MLGETASFDGDMAAALGVVIRVVVGDITLVDDDVLFVIDIVFG